MPFRLRSLLLLLLPSSLVLSSSSVVIVRQIGEFSLLIHSIFIFIRKFYCFSVSGIVLAARDDEEDENEEGKRLNIKKMKKKR
jgi:hypothetical protein